MASVITLGEIAFGHAIAEKPDANKQAAFNAFVQTKFPLPIAITRTTIPYYAAMREAIFKKVSAVREEAEKRPEQCFDPITAMELGIEENDLWIAAQACEHKLVLVTNVYGMARIRDIAIDLLTVENWTEPT